MNGFLDFEILVSRLNLPIRFDLKVLCVHVARRYIDRCANPLFCVVMAAHTRCFHRSIAIPRRILRQSGSKRNGQDAAKPGKREQRSFVMIYSGLQYFKYL